MAATLCCRGLKLRVLSLESGKLSLLSNKVMSASKRVTGDVP